MLNYFLFMAMPVLVWLAFSIIYNKPINSSDRLRRRYLIICGFFLFLMVALKHYSVGSGDGEWYYRNWATLGDMHIRVFENALERYDMETGYLFTIWLLSHVFKDPQFLFITYGLLVSVSVCRFLYKNCDDLVVGLTMFSTLGLWSFMVQGLRQGIAMCICLFAIEFCKKRKFIPFLLTVLLASLFHASAVVFLIVYTFTWFKMNIRGYLSVGVCAVICVASVEFLFEIVDTVLNDTFALGDLGDTEGGVVSALIYVLILLLSLYVYKGEKPDDPHLSLFFYMLLCSFVTYMMRYTANTISQRISFYFMFSQMAVLPGALKGIRGAGQPFAKAVVVLLCLGIAAYKATYSDLVPYIFFWQN